MTENHISIVPSIKFDNRGSPTSTMRPITIPITCRVHTKGLFESIRDIQRKLRILCQFSKRKAEIIIKILYFQAYL